MTIAQQVRHAADVLDRTEKAGDFLAYARVLVATATMNGVTSGEVGRALRVGPRVMEIAKGGIGPMGTDSAVLFASMANGFSESLRSRSVFDRLLASGARRVPLNSHAFVISSGITGSRVAEGSVKPVSSLSVTTETLDPIKVSAIVAASNELLKFLNPSAQGLFDTELRTSAAAATNLAFLAGLIALTTPTASAGATAADILTDLATLLGEITVSENSKLFFVLHGDNGKKLPTKVNGPAGAIAFPKFSPTGGGEILPGITGLISNDMPAGTALRCCRSHAGRRRR
jgi:hypothetical protein